MNFEVFHRLVHVLYCNRNFVCAPKLSFFQRFQQRKEKLSNSRKMLAELNSVIAHRLVETKIRERKALLKSRGNLPTSDAEEPPSESPAAGSPDKTVRAKNSSNV